LHRRNEEFSGMKRRFIARRRSNTLIGSLQGAQELQRGGTTSRFFREAVNTPNE
jgi:hypothetical protein